MAEKKLSFYKYLLNLENMSDSVVSKDKERMF